MAITLTPELEAMMVEDAQARGYESPEAYVAEHLTALHEAEAYLREHSDEISAMIDEGLNEAEDADLTPEQAKAEIAEWKREYLAKRNVA
jgi:hypothetical protein